MTDSSRRAWGHGLATLTDDGTVLDTWFPAPALGAAPEEEPPHELTELEDEDERRRVDTRVITVDIDLDAPPTSTADAYLRLALLSHLLVRPNTVNLDGLFGRLPNVVWTTVGPMVPADFADLRGQLRRAGVEATGMDKFPRLLDYVVPERVRIADASRVRLGA
ncbi:MAG: 2,3,4,5-tetrahydropyridine-2,6-dicarboxylate N-succinyltransferase, partial [Microbacteriaceae bacterium]|nr:2,3,4,5-tetrahydropyridine-2,6-dicarboxylate N-succinyltransferase [Microbacteriaceae bacterium]